MLPKGPCMHIVHIEGSKGASLHYRATWTSWVRGYLGILQSYALVYQHQGTKGRGSRILGKLS